MAVRILLVEGNDDQHVMWNLFDHSLQSSDLFVLRPGDQPHPGKPGLVIRGQGENGGTEDNGGDTKLLESIPARLDTTGLECLAIVIDADLKGPRARWDAIRQRLVDEGYKDLPKRPDPRGTILDLPSRRGRKPLRFGVWIMPDNNKNGMLEDFVAKMIRKDDDMLPRVDGFLESIKQQWRFSQEHLAKARIHSWLAIQKGPGKPMGQAIGAKKYLDMNREVVEPFLKWITDVLITDGQQP